MNKILLVSIAGAISLLISGCATDPIQKEYQDLKALYKSGQINAYEYAVAKEKIVKEELER